MAETNGLWAQERYYPVWLLAFSGLLYFLGLGSRDFWAPVEPRYGEIVRVMFAHDQWIVPMVNGELYTDKPILYYPLPVRFRYSHSAKNGAMGLISWETVTRHS